MSRAERVRIGADAAAAPLVNAVMTLVAMDLAATLVVMDATAVLVLVGLMQDIRTLRIVGNAPALAVMLVLVVQMGMAGHWLPPSHQIEENWLPPNSGWTFVEVIDAIETAVGDTIICSRTTLLDATEEI